MKKEKHQQWVSDVTVLLILYMLANFWRSFTVNYHKDLFPVFCGANKLYFCFYVFYLMYVSCVIIKFTCSFVRTFLFSNIYIYKIMNRITTINLNVQTSARAMVFLMFYVLFMLQSYLI